MTSNSKIPWPETPDTPVQRVAPAAGKAAEHRMEMEAGGMDGIRRVDRIDIDGTTHTLNTRKGNPIIRAKKVTTTTEISVVRGFVAHVPTATEAARFSPYTLAIADPKYKIYRNGYTVLPFATTYNVPVSDSTKWNDVASFYASKILINGKEMSLLKTTGLPSGAYVPWIIPAPTGSGITKYSDAATNNTVKRVFAVGRYEVKSWFSSGLTETLLPIEARTNEKALTIGQHIDTVTNAAYLGLIYSFPYNRLWDDLYAEWRWSSAKVDMSLALPYLIQVASSGLCDMPIARLLNTGTSTGPVDNPTTLPSIQLWLTGGGVLAYSAPATRLVQWPWGGTASATMQGMVHGSYSRISYSGSKGSALTLGGVPVTYSGSNIKDFDLRNESTNILEQTITLFPQHPFEVLTEEANANATTIIWPEADPLSYRGRTTYYTGGGGIIGSSIVRNYDSQMGSFTVTTPYGELVALSFSKNTSYGQFASLSPKNDYYDVYLADPYGLIAAPSGLGMFSHVSLGYHYNAASDRIEIYDVYKQNPNPPPRQTADVLAEIEAEFDNRVAKYLSQTMYDNENTSGIFERTTYYYCTITNETHSSSSLTWSTTDYILHDVDNGVFISITSSFSGADTVATLTVSLKVKTRFSEAVKELHTFDYTYGEMLPEKPLDSSGRTAVPSPQIRAMFAPLYQEQGSFKGAHYVTAAEEANGAAPAHLFNFNLYLQNYNDLGTCNDSNATNEGVYFVPCNLLEMLYAYVFSSKYGVDDYQRYPVDNVAQYNGVMTALFTTPIRVECRDGVFSDWLLPFAGAYATSKTTELTRT